MRGKAKSKTLNFVAGLVLLIGGISLIRSTVGQGTDFLVFWKAGQALLSGTSFYQVEALGGMVFKYPPWIAPLFLPISIFSFEAAKWIWGVFCCLSLFGILFIFSKRLKIEMKAWLPVTLLYWGVWVIHALDGQIILPILLFLVYGAVQEKPSAFWQSFAPFLLSTKVFTEFPVFLRWKEFLSKRVVLISIFLVVIFSSITCFMSFHGDFSAMFSDWLRAAASGARYLPPGHTRGSKNHSLSILLCRGLRIPSTETGTEILISVLMYFVFWLLARKRLALKSRFEQWMIAIAITPVFHPLPWQHLYILTFPIAVLGMQRAFVSNRSFQIKYALALFLLTLSSERAYIGIGSFLELYSGRAWGALFMVLLFLEEPEDHPQSISRP